MTKTRKPCGHPSARIFKLPSGCIYCGACAKTWLPADTAPARLRRVARRTGRDYTHELTVDVASRT